VALLVVARYALPGGPVALRAADPKFDPRWVFYGAGPDDALRDHLTKARIIFVEHR
jgi:hypothetical protein